MSKNCGPDFKVEVYQKDGQLIDVKIDRETQEVWVTKKQIAKLFDVERNTISEHITSIYNDGELEPSSTCRPFRLVRNEGNRRVTRTIYHYNIDMVTFIGFRVNGRRAVEFRRWASELIKSYLRDGFVINEKALRESPEKTNELAAKIRAIRADERHVYDKLKYCFKESASDYDSRSQEVRNFYSKMQDKFHYAITGMVSARLILDRANHEDDNMGLSTFAGVSPTQKEVTVGKNYLKETELYRMNLLSEQFLLHAETTALKGKQMTMRSLNEHIDKLLLFNEYELLPDSRNGAALRDEANEHAQRQYKLFKKKRIIEKSGYIYDPELMAYGEYNHLFDDED
ncbi:RhuM family protein [Xenorhabdus taiwanensis]|uniref:RhuM family protein n=1 Tax=Xenorhabdus taiwanensis TaxID=3085177 RepID=A0ABM8JUW1_9GAMM|nr:RhuM family protein [Xenorhabdus sp. TCT-1]BET97325.1 RhuM family protein [Xenorhabdus sp. TCT-1]